MKSRVVVVTVIQVTVYSTALLIGVACQKADLSPNRALMDQTDDAFHLSGEDSQSPSFSRRPIWVIPEEPSPDLAGSGTGAPVLEQPESLPYTEPYAESDAQSGTDADPVSATDHQGPSNIPKQFVSWFDTEIEPEPVLSTCRGLQYEGFFTPLVPGPKACEIPKDREEELSAQGDTTGPEAQQIQLPDLIIGGAQDIGDNRLADPAAAQYTEQLDILFILHSAKPLNDRSSEILAQSKKALAQLPNKLRWNQEQMESLDYNIGLFVTTGTQVERGQPPTHAQLIEGTSVGSAEFMRQGLSHSQTLDQVDRRLVQATQQLPARGNELSRRQGYVGLVDLTEVLTRRTPFDQTFSQAGLFRPGATTAIIFITDARTACNGSAETAQGSSSRRGLFGRRAQETDPFCIYDVYMAAGEPLTTEEAQGLLSFLTTAP